MPDLAHYNPTQFQAYLDELNNAQIELASGFISSPTATDRATAERNAATQSSQLTALKSDLAQLNNQNQANNTIIETYQAALYATPPPSTEQAHLLNTQLQPYLDIQSQLILGIKATSDTIKALQSSKGPLPQAIFAALDNASSAAAVLTIPTPGFTRIEYNVGSVEEAYFHTRQGFLKELAPVPGNKPVAVNNASELWANGVANKGIIQTWQKPDYADKYIQDPLTGHLVGASSAIPPTGFQFQYNPTSVDMQYTGVPGTDAAYEMSGADKFNLTGTGTTQSTIGIQILINRVYDMKYYGTNGLLKPGAENVYSPVPPSVQDQKDIYNKGTMYDVEYLLRTLLGMNMPSYLRGENSADMGFIGAVPVELHLGKSLRYLVTINQMSVTHGLFNERMVPLFSTLNISCNRMPDYASLNPNLDANLAKNKADAKALADQAAANANNVTGLEQNGQVLSSGRGPSQVLMH